MGCGFIADRAGPGVVAVCLDRHGVCIPGFSGAIGCTSTEYQ